jgi:hypothetical protein
MASGWRSCRLKLEYPPDWRASGGGEFFSVKSHGYLMRLALGTFAIGATACVFLSGCSDVGFPSVHDMPGPRADTPLTPDEVKAATDNLIIERNQLSTEAQAVTAQTNGSANAAGNSSQQKQPATLQPAAAQTPTPTAQPATAYARP